MWRRVVSCSWSALGLRALASPSCRSSPSLKLSRRFLISSVCTPSTPPPFPNLAPVCPLLRTGHELGKLEAELEGRDILEINHPVSPFGTKEAPAIVKSYYDKRIVGCPGVQDEDEHDVVWFCLEKGKPHECPVCSQYFKLEVIGPGGPPDGHH